MKTSGFREIDFSKTECKNCGNDCIGFIQMKLPKGYTMKFDKQLSEKIEPCPVCKGTGFIDESVTTELELE